MVECKNPKRSNEVHHVYLSAIFLFLSSFLFAGTIVEEIVARVGNEIITKSEYEHQLSRLRDELSRRYQGEELEEQFHQQKDMLLEFMVNQRLLEQRAKEMDITVDEEIQAAIKRLKEENKIEDDAALEAALRKEGSSLSQLREDFRRRIIQQKILWNYVQGKVNITEDEIKNYYQQNKQEMMTQALTNVRRYAVSDPEAPKETLRAEAQTVLADLRNGKDVKDGDFPHVTVADPTDLSVTELDPKFVEVLEATQVGAFTDLLETPTGYLILKVERRKEAEPTPFEEARGRIYNLLLQQRAEKYQKSFLEDLRKQSYVVIHQPSS